MKRLIAMIIVFIVCFQTVIIPKAAYSDLSIKIDNVSSEEITDNNVLDIIINEHTVDFYAQIAPDSQRYVITLTDFKDSIIYTTSTDFGGSIHGSINMENLSGGMYTLDIADESGYSLTKKFYCYTDEEIQYFLYKLSTGQIQSTSEFRECMKNFGLFTGTVMDLYEYYNNDVYEEAVLFKISGKQYDSLLQLQDAVVEKYILTVIELCNGWAEIDFLLNKFYDVIGLNLSKYNNLHIEKKCVICKELSLKEFNCLNDINDVLQELISENNASSSRPNYGGGGSSGGGGGRAGISYDFVRKLVYEEINDNEICITGIETENPTEITNIIIPKGIDGKTVTSIGEEAFGSLSEVRMIAIPETVETVSENAFSGMAYLENVYFYGNSTAVFVAMALSSNVNVHCYDDSEIYTNAQNQGYNVLPIYEYTVSFKYEEDSYISATITDNSEDFTAVARLYIRDSEGTREIQIVDTDAEPVCFEFTPQTEIFVYEERTGDFNRITSIPQNITGAKTDIFDYLYEVKELVYEPAKRQIRIVPEINENTDAEAEDEVLIRFFDLTNGSRNLFDFQKVKSKCGEEIIYELPDIYTSGSYAVEVCFNSRQFNLLNEEDMQSKLNELKNGVSDSARIRELIDNLGFILNPDEISIWYGNLNEDGILKIGECLKGQAVNLAQMYEIFCEKAFLLSIYEPYTYNDASTIESIICEEINADYDVLESEDKLILFENIYKTSFSSKAELENYIQEYILKKQTFTVTFIGHNGQAISEQKITGLSDATAPAVDGEVVIGDRVYVFDGWDCDFTSVRKNLNVKAVYIPQYYAKFIVDGKLYKSFEFTSKNPVPEINVPEKTGYTGEWEKFEQGDADLTINALYTPIKYELSFVADGKNVKKVPFTVEDTNIAIPPVPEKAGYDGYWNEFEINEAFIKAKDFVIEAYYLSTKCEIIQINGNKVSGKEITLPDCDSEYLPIVLQIDEKASAEIIANTDINGNVILQKGNNRFTIRIIAESGIFADYNIDVYRRFDECEVISVDHGSISQNNIVLDSVPYNTQSIEINPVVSNLAEWEMYADENLTQKLSTINLSDGENKLWLKVIAENGEYRVYVISVVRRKRLEAVECSIPSGCYIADGSFIELSHPNKGAVIYYTTDGSVPDKDSAVYDGAIPFNGDITISAVAVYEGYDASAVQIFKYVSAKPISNVEIVQIFENNAIITFDKIEGAQQIRVFAENISTDKYETEAVINDEKTSVLVSGLVPDIYTRLTIEAVYPNGIISAQTRWFITEEPISSDCEIIHIGDPNAIIDNDDLTVNNITVLNKEKEIKIEAYVSTGATYAVYPSRYSTSAYADNTVPLNIGKNIFFIKVTAFDKITQKTYKVTVYRNTKADKPTISINNNTATIIADKGVKILYTTDNSAPNPVTGIEYIAPFEVCEGMVIRAVTVDEERDEVSDEEIFIVNTQAGKYILDLIDLNQTDEYCEYNFNIVSNGNLLPADAILIAAQYRSNGEFVNLNYCPLTLEKEDTIINKKFDKEYEDSYFKIMLWNSFYKCTPLAKVIK